jgi:hypothetical protein
MRHVVLILSLAAAVLVFAVAPASATVHPLSNSECSADAANGTPADTQDPPGLTPGGPDSSHADVAQPVRAVLNAPGGGADSPAFKTAPAPGTPDFCPAQNP